jgi:hypothetical protein
MPAYGLIALGKHFEQPVQPMHLQWALAAIQIFPGVVYNSSQQRILTHTINRLYGSHDEEHYNV